jgi:hypothetical protein
MHLIPCPACGREISTQAEACPQCGHPNQHISLPAKNEPACYCCDRRATTRCQNCNALSCGLHLYNVFRWHSTKHGSHDLLCGDCVKSHNRWVMLGWYLIGAGLALAILGMIVLIALKNS